MPSAIANLDHPVIAVHDMAASRAAYERLGFTVAPRGSHLEWGTGNWCIMFPSDYLELRGIIDGGKYTHHLDEFLAAHGEGLMGMAFGAVDAGESHRLLVERGLHPQPVRTLTRNFEVPGGPLQPQFSLCFLDPAETPGLMSVVLCQHLTPELLRRSEWMQHPNGALGVRSITGVVNDLDAAAEAHAKLFGLHALDRRGELLVIQVGRNQSIRLATRRKFAKMCADVEPPPLCHGDALVTVTLEVGDLAQSAEYFAAQRLALTHRDDHSMRVAREEACGVVLEFVAQTKGERF